MLTRQDAAKALQRLFRRRHVAGLDELYEALDADLPILAAIGARTVLDCAMVLKGAPEAAGFDEKLGFLEAEGLVGQGEKELLSILTDAGGAAAHRGWRPQPDDLMTILDGIEAFVQRAFVLGDAVEAIRESVPPRKSRSKKTRA